MKALILAATVLGITSGAYAKECPSIMSPGYGFFTSGDTWNNGSATLRYKGDGIAVNGKTYAIDVGADSLTTWIVYSGQNVALSPDKPTGNFVSPDLAKLVGGSPTFIRKCR